MKNNNLKKSKLTCLQTLRPPSGNLHNVVTSAQFISNTDSLLDSYSHASPSGSSQSTTATSSISISPVWHCAWSTDGSILATSHGRPDACIRLWKCQHETIPQSPRVTAPTTNDDDDDDDDDESLSGAPSWHLIATLRAEGDTSGGLSHHNMTKSKS
eukprot:CAMPEP_0176490852 /NCGR_PEP_ID=MMETSP0200_2-20121128/8104_1 /TAXON_ID=947934 /ORGANISM="Chaetoceros sp., Strain GSL56" /LENGTH=156 /DNA_ID=CAMNT_0017888211 /DNA_START=95 /DNA_END=562 /DNA_ORIENTATION=+